MNKLLILILFLFFLNNLLFIHLFADMIDKIDT